MTEFFNAMIHGDGFQVIRAVIAIMMLYLFFGAAVSVIRNAVMAVIVVKREVEKK